jgi:hypothetical protein
VGRGKGDRVSLVLLASRTTLLRVRRRSFFCGVFLAVDGKIEQVAGADS